MVRPTSTPGCCICLAMIDGVYGIILAGWAVELEVRVPRARCVPRRRWSVYECDGIRVVGRTGGAGSLNLSEIAGAGGRGGLFDWVWLPLLPRLSSITSPAWTRPTVRVDVAEGESEIVAGFHVEYSGAAFAVFLLAEYANMILISSSPRSCRRWLAVAVTAIVGFHWPAGHLVAVDQGALLRVLLLWFRATFPRSATTRSCVWAGRSSFHTLVWVLVAACFVHWGGPVGV